MAGKVRLAVELSVGLGWGPYVLVASVLLLKEIATFEIVVVKAGVGSVRGKKTLCHVAKGT